jgi:hypothetical protein
MFRSALLVALLAVLMFVLNETSAVYINCAPDPGLQKKPCQKLIKKCKNIFGVKMKWTGIGTVLDHQVQGDGGCQCDQYCGYFTADPCNRDDQCIWKNGACYNRASNNIGAPVLQCPLTLLPTKSPTTSKPTFSPTTSKPSTSPTTSKPSQTPSKAPTKNPTTSTPSQAPSKSPTVFSSG